MRIFDHGFSFIDDDFCGVFHCSLTRLLSYLRPLLSMFGGYWWL
jgi:hypothetical protein